MNSEENDLVGDLPDINRRGKNVSDESDKSTSTGSTGTTDLSTPDRQASEEPLEKRKPSALEVKLYYNGFPTQPPLVARTGSKPWNLRAPLKAMGNVGSRHRLVGLWPSVVEEIIQALKPLDWASIDLLRVGNQGTKEKDWPVTLLVAVAPGTSFEKAFPVAASCKDVLLAHNVEDVECEMRESHTFHSAAQKLITADEAVGRRSHVRLFSECIGQTISPCATPGLQGKLGLYLTVGPRDELCALTCRHVVFGEFETETALKQTITDKGFHRGVAQPGKNSFDKILDAEAQVCHLEGKETALMKRLKAEKTLDDRRIGHVFFSPPRTLDKDKWLQDWLLVKLDAKRYTNLSALQNWIWVGHEGLWTMMKHLSNKTKMAKKPNDFIVRLKGFVPKSEIVRTTAEEDATTENKALWVHMCGRHASDLSTGVSNEVCSVRRFKPAVDSDEIITTTEWCVVGRDVYGEGVYHGVDSQGGRLNPFSMKGDSGSVVFDSEGRIAGILTSGVGYKQDLKQGTNNWFDYADMSYATPIEVILDAIRAKFGRVGIP